jgi:hypothetical protein
LQGTGKFMRHVKLEDRERPQNAAALQADRRGVLDIKARVENG